ncbi:hypothetical protein C0995_011741 [Termitomyces sp. Mi166|nr:hypothetical protein C0995_011741 [Termitomyces sp. Mi166\
MTARNRHQADMTKFPQSENALINKLENIAGVTNENALSDTEILQGHVLLAKARDDLYDHSSLADHISRLSIALAPHKSLPPEILERILRFNPHRTAIVHVPVNLTQYPWVLGRVCSSWRRISRSIPDLWYTLINFGTKVDKTDLDYDVASLRDLSYATDILPEVAYLALYINDGTRVPIRGLSSYLHRLDKLDWNVRPSSDQATLEAFPPESLSRVKNLRISMVLPETEEISDTISYPVLFGESSCLQHLSFVSKDPSFLLSTDIPWSQLLSLCIDSFFSETMHPSWLLLGRRDPFQQLTCLKELTLDLNTIIFRVVLHNGFLWHRLEGLFLRCSELYEVEDFNDGTVQYPSADSLRELLVLLKSCSIVVIRAVVFPEEILDEIGCGSLFPEARTLSFYASSPELILASIRRRLEQERESGHVRLREITGRALKKTLNANKGYLEANVKDLQMEFGVDLRFSPPYI